jgi:hypothetical protein
MLGVVAQLRLLRQMEGIVNLQIQALSRQKRCNQVDDQIPAGQFECVQPIAFYGSKLKLIIEPIGLDD